MTAVEAPTGPEETPDWLANVDDRIVSCLSSTMSQEYFGLFAISADAAVPFDLQSSAKALSVLDRVGAVEDLPGYSESAVEETIEYVRGLQDSETGYFTDPHLEGRLTSPDDDETVLNFKKSTSKWAEAVLDALGSEPHHSFYTTGDESGKPDPDGVLRNIRELPWETEPWHAGSHAGGRIREMFYLVEEGHEEYTPYVEEATELVLSKQDPETGLWGAPSTPLYQRISGALKLVSRFTFYLGFFIPNLEALADTCIENHGNRRFYEESDSHCIPRNVAEVCEVCLLDSEYRREELLETLDSVASCQHQTFGMPDGGYAQDPSGTRPLSWSHVGEIAPEASHPRSDIPGVAGALWCFGIVADRLDWAAPVDSPQAGWRERVDDLDHELVVEGDGTVTMRKT